MRTWTERQVGANPIQHVNYSYDTVDQLTQEASTEAQPQINTGYSYDAMGNRSSAQASGTYTGIYSNSYTPNKLNQILSHSTTSGGTTNTRNLSYDRSGNLTRQTLSGGASNGGSTYSYDEADRLVQVVRANETTGINEGKSEFVYDGASRKVINREYTWNNGAWLQSSETRRIYDGMDVVQERDGANAVTVSYTRSGNIGGLLARSTSSGHFYYHYDGSGNVMQLTDAAQATVADYKYDAYGNLLSSSGAQSGQPYRYSTKEYHSSTGLYDYGYRFYSPSLGRWINRDPIEEDGGLNLYGFVGNSPVNDWDEYGLVAPIAIGIGVGIGRAVLPRLLPVIGRALPRIFPPLARGLPRIFPPLSPARPRILPPGGFPRQAPPIPFIPRIPSIDEPFIPPVSLPPLPPNPSRSTCIAKCAAIYVLPDPFSASGHASFVKCVIDNCAGKGPCKWPTYEPGP